MSDVTNETATAAPAAPETAAPSPNSTEGARAAALKALEAAEAAESAPAEEPKEAAKAEPPAEKEEAAEEKEIEAKEEKEENKEEKKEERDTLLKKSFDVLAREKAALRKEREEAKAEKAELAKYRTLDLAVKNKDPMGVLAALGLPYSTLVDQLTGRKTEEKPSEAQTASKKEEEYLQRIEALEQARKEEKYQRDVQALDSQIEKLALSKKDKFKLSTSEDDFAAGVRDYLLNHIKETGSPPGEDLEESIEMALEAIEAKFEAQAAKWRKKLGLTAAEMSNTITKAESAAESVKSVTTKSKTLSNSHASAPVASPTKLSSSTDYRKAALEALNKLD